MSAHSKHQPQMESVEELVVNDHEHSQYDKLIDFTTLLNPVEQSLR